MPGKLIYMAMASLLGVWCALESIWLAVICLIVLVSRLFVRSRMSGRITAFAAITLIVSFCAGATAEKGLKSSFGEGELFRQTITFKDVPEINGDRLRAIVETEEEENLMLTYRIKSELEKEALASRVAAGDRCMLSGKLSAPHPARNQFAFDYALFLQRKNIHWLLEPDELAISACERSGQNALSVLRNIRHAGIERIDAEFPPIFGGYAKALIFGDRSSLSPEADLAYKRLGVVHLLAISGLHVGMIAGALYFICLRLGMTRENALWLLLIFLPVYAVLSGGNPPVLRAVTMTMMVLTVQKFRLSITVLDAFSISFLLFLFIDPFLIYHIGFQLSYCVSFALILSSSLIFRPGASLLKQMCTTSFISLLASFPLLAFHFFEFSVMSLAANVIFVPFYTFIVLPASFGLFLLFLMGFSYAHAVGEWVEAIIVWSETWAYSAGTLPFAVLLTGRPGFIWICGMVLSVLLFMIMTEKKCRFPLAVLPIVAVLLLQQFFLRYSPQGEVIFIDVGQGDSTLIKLPRNEGNYLIDTGGQIEFPLDDWQKKRDPFRMGRDVVVPVLKSHGISRIDKLILTHPDADHMGAAQELLEHTEVGEIFISTLSWQKPMMENLVKRAAEKQIPVREVEAGEKWSTPSASFEIIYPIDDQFEGNNHSLVVFASLGGMTWLFTGDAEKEAEAEMAAVYPVLAADILKVGHHGSRSSTTDIFLKKVNPDISVISSGVSNRYGHPHAEVLETLEKSGSTVLRTDQLGAIHYTFTQNGQGTFSAVLPYDKPERRPARRGNGE